MRNQPSKDHSTTPAESNPTQDLNTTLSTSQSRLRLGSADADRALEVCDHRLQVAMEVLQEQIDLLVQRAAESTQYFGKTLKWREDLTEAIEQLIEYEIDPRLVPFIRVELEDCGDTLPWLQDRVPVVVEPEVRDVSYKTLSCQEAQAARLVVFAEYRNAFQTLVHALLTERDIRSDDQRLKVATQCEELLDQLHGDTVSTELLPYLEHLMSLHDGQKLAGHSWGLRSEAAVQRIPSFTGRKVEEAIAFIDWLAQGFVKYLRDPENIYDGLNFFHEVCRQRGRDFFLDCPEPDEIHIMVIPELDLLAAKAVGDFSTRFAENFQALHSGRLKFAAIEVEVNTRYRRPLIWTNKVEYDLLIEWALCYLEELVHQQQNRAAEIKIRSASTANPTPAIKALLSGRYDFELFKHEAVSQLIWDFLAARPEVLKTMNAYKFSEIDVLARMIELMQGSGCDLRSLRPFATVFHRAERVEFVKWAQAEGHLPQFSKRAY